MSTQAYVRKKFSDTSIRLIAMANHFIAKYAEEGFTLTLRQLYYQFVAKDLIPNTQRSYKAIGSIMNDARMAGLIDWEAIEDRTRNLKGNSHWKDAKEMVRTLASVLRLDCWKANHTRVEVWIEKEALAGVVDQVCHELDVPYLSCKGYTSQSAMWESAQRINKYELYGQDAVIVHLGDHDPSGIDMTRDIQHRLNVFRCSAVVERIALTAEQIEQYKLPPNPAKTTDSRFKEYAIEHGDDSWELDALEPSVIVELIRDAVMQHIDPNILDAMKTVERVQQAEMVAVADNWEEAVRAVNAIKTDKTIKEGKTVKEITKRKKR